MSIGIVLLRVLVRQSYCCGNMCIASLSFLGGNLIADSFILQFLKSFHSLFCDILTILPEKCYLSCRNGRYYLLRKDIECKVFSALSPVVSYCNSLFLLQQCFDEGWVTLIYECKESMELYLFREMSLVVSSLSSMGFLALGS